MIGDCQTAALVARNGSIDWLCWPRFDSAACFAALLGSEHNGHWRIAPADPDPKVRRRYRDGTLILETEFETPSGAVTLIDFMPVRESISDLVRLVVGRRGRVTMDMELALRFGYGASVAWGTRLADGKNGIRAIAGPDMAVLRSPVTLRGEGMMTRASFDVEAGTTVPFVLTHSPSHLDLPAPIDAAAALEKTTKFWRDWSGKSSVPGAWSEAVTRSLYQPSG